MALPLAVGVLLSRHVRHGRLVLLGEHLLARIARLTMLVDRRAWRCDLHLILALVVVDAALVIAELVHPPRVGERLCLLSIW